ncbi:MAG TPA: hypothetical protein DCD98_01880 [Syntrophomonas sp.]|nr:hypothetical protein [Syntrophomonas sp.]
MKHRDVLFASFPFLAKGQRKRKQKERPMLLRHHISLLPWVLSHFRFKTFFRIIENYQAANS